MEKVSAMLKGGGGVTQSFGVVFTWSSEVLAILKEGGVSQKCFHFIKGGGGARKVLPCLDGGGGAKSFGPAVFPFCRPLSP